MNGPYLFFRFGDTELAFLVIGIDKILEDRVTFPKGEIRVPRPHQEKKKKNTQILWSKVRRVGVLTCDQLLWEYD